MEIIQKRERLFLKTDTFCNELGYVIPYINTKLRNYDLLLKERNLLEAQLVQANQNIEDLLRELRKFDPIRHQPK